MRYLPRLYLDIHVRGALLPGGGGGGGEGPEQKDAGPPAPVPLADDSSLPVLLQNYCVLAKLRDFVASPQCWRVAPVDTLKDKVRKLYTIMNSFCRRVSDAVGSSFSCVLGRGF